MTGDCGDCGDCGDIPTVSEHTGLVTVVTLLRARVPDVVPVVTFNKTAAGYRVEFARHASTVALLKSAVPAAARRWRDTSKHWTVSVDWAGPLVAALRNAGVEVVGLDEFEEAELFWWALTAPTTKGYCAYLKGLCTACRKVRHRSGGVECDPCYRARVLRQHRVRRTLAARGLAPYPHAAPSAGSAARCRVPVWADDDDVAVPEAPDYTVALNAVILAARDQVDKPPCPICGRRPAKGAVVHVACRRRLLHALLGKPFTKPRNTAWQRGSCSVCVVRPHRLPGHITCEHCDALVREIEVSS